MLLNIRFETSNVQCIIKLEYSGVDGLFDASVHLLGRWGRLGGLAGRFLYPDKLASLQVPAFFSEKSPDNRFPCSQVWHLVEHRLVRWLLRDFNLHNVHLANTFLAVSELNDITDPENKECITVVLDVHQLVDEKVELTKIWSRRFSFNPGPGRDNQINAVTNDTSLIVSHDSMISIIDFWNE